MNEKIDDRQPEDGIPEMLSPEVMIEAIADAYVQVDRTNRVCYMNSNAERLLRRTRGDAIGQTLEDVVPDATKAHQWPLLIHAIGEKSRTDIALFYPNQYVWHEVSVVPAAGGGAGLFMRDVTDRQWLIRREAERVYLKNVFESAPVAITVMRGPKHVVEYINAFGRKLVGGRPFEGKPIREALSEIEDSAIFDTLDQVYERGVEFQATDLFVRLDRNGDGQLEDAWFDVSYQPARDFDGTISGVLSLSIDVTDRERKRS